MDQLGDNDSVTDFIMNIHHKIDEIIKVVNTAYPELALRLYLVSAANLNQMKISQEKFFDLYKYYMNTAIGILKEVNLEQKEKLNLLNNTMGILSLSKLSEAKNMERLMR